MSQMPIEAGRVEQILAAPAGRRLLAELAGVHFGELVNSLELPNPPNCALLRSGSPGGHKRQTTRIPHLRPIGDSQRWIGHRYGRRRAAGVFRESVLNMSPERVASMVRRVRTDRNDGQAGAVSARKALQALAYAIESFGFTGNDTEYDQLLRDAVEEFRSSAESLVSSSATAWWWDDLPLDDQRYAERARGAGEGGGPPRQEAVTVEVVGAVTQLREDEAHATRHRRSARDVPKYASGCWWSMPLRGFWTSRPVPPVPALCLACAEERSDERFTVWSVRMSATARIYEVREPSDWGRLVDMAPIDVTTSRLSDWRRWTKRDGPFYLPDWQAVSNHFDGVHVSVGGYLTTRSIPVPVADGISVLAGWDPDATLWLRDVVQAVERVGECSGPFSFVPSDTG